MIQGIYMKNGLVTARGSAPLSREEREHLSQATTVEQFFMSEKALSAQARAQGLGLDVVRMVDRQRASERCADTIMHLSQQQVTLEGASFLEGIWDESEVGQSLVWPRAERNRRLAQTDYVEYPGYRAGKSEERLAAEDAYRAQLRELPDTHPDPALIVWPGRP